MESGRAIPYTKAASAAPPQMAGADDEHLAWLPPGPPPGMPPHVVELPPPPPGFEVNLASLGHWSGCPPPEPPTEEFPFPGPGLEPPGPPDFPPPDDMQLLGIPPGMPPFFGGELPPGFPPGFAPVLGPLGPPEDIAGDLVSHGPDPLHPDTVKVKAPPPSHPDEARKRKKAKVEGLAPATHIKTGGAITIYSGYSEVKAVPQGSQAPSRPAQPERQQQQQVASAAAGTEALPRQLPEGWEMKRSRTSGRIYYVNEKLGKSQFEPPAGSTLKTQARKKQKVPSRPKDSVDAQLSDKNGVMGLVRAGDKRTGRWQRWQQCSQLLNEEPEEDAAA